MLYTLVLRRASAPPARALRTCLQASVHMSTSAQVNRELRREQNSAYNCLLSILDDSRFVCEIAALYPGLPVFANLRCGLWYVQQAQHTCYFKSTDGHCGQWSFSTTRLNLHVAKAAAAAGGVIIVDATRRGKTFPVRERRSCRNAWPLRTMRVGLACCSKIRVRCHAWPVCTLVGAAQPSRTAGCSVQDHTDLGSDNQQRPFPAATSCEWPGRGQQQRCT